MKKKILTTTLMYLPVVILFSLALQACALKAMPESASQPRDKEPQQSASVVNAEARSANNQDVERLLAIIRDERLRGSDPERVTKAIERLGEIRAIAAIDDLAQLLSFRGSFDWEKSQVPGVLNHLVLPSDLYPATTALFQIGKPSLPALIKAIETHESGSLTSKNAVDTTILIHREKPLKGIAYLRQAAAEASTPEASKRLSEAAKQIEDRVKK